MSSILCNAPFCQNTIKYSKSKYCSPHQIERQKLKITAYKELLPLWSVKLCKIHGYLRPSQTIKRLNKNQYICKFCAKNHRQPKPFTSELSKARKKERALIKLYGIDQKCYDEILKRQNNLCGICKTYLLNYDSSTGVLRKMATDHCHKTKVVRGILCFKCNIGLGSFQDNISILENALNYLRPYE